MQDPASHEPARASGRGAFRRAGVAVAGGATVLVGVALIPLPGPGTLVVLGGLAVLRKEFPAAGRAADGIRSAARNTTRRVRRSPGREGSGRGV
ncbi:MAG TPA: PGPGW domain-containing protein [Acidimicrobiia bacterium]|nr:PGPGW domain-containing protein [Acidimicrobiia bacterium]